MLTCPSPPPVINPGQVLQHTNTYSDLGRSGLDPEGLRSICLDLPPPPVDPEQVLQHVQVYSPVHQQLTALCVPRAVALALVEKILQSLPDNLHTRYESEHLTTRDPPPHHHGWRSP